MKIKKIFPLILVFLSFIVALIVSPYAPYLMASHWGVSGQVDGYMSKNMGLFFMPVLSLFIYVLLLFLPKLDPYKKNFFEFEHHYDNFMIVIFSFFLYIYLLTIFWNLNYRFNMVQFISPAFSLLFYFTGDLISKTKRNWFVGIRTPWTMNSPVVWKKTHAVGAKLFKLVAMFSFFGVFFPAYTFYLLFIPILFTVIFVFAYSYYEYSKLNK